MMAKLKIYPTREYLLECFDYKKENGELFWKRRPSSHFDGKTEWRVFNSRFTGKLAGCGCCDGRRVSVGKTIFFRHILIFIIETGRPPKNRLVKINGDFGDDRFSNLDIRNNGSVIRHTSGNFDAITTSNGKQSYAGRFSNPDDAQHKLAEIKEQIRKGHYVKKIRSAKNGFYGVRISAKGEIKAEIKVNGKKHNLGVFKSKQEASSAYQNAKKRISDGVFVETSPYRENKTGFVGVSKRREGYKAIYKRKYLGQFSTAELAHEAYLKAKNPPPTIADGLEMLRQLANEYGQ